MQKQNESFLNHKFQNGDHTLDGKSSLGKPEESLKQTKLRFNDEPVENLQQQHLKMNQNPNSMRPVMSEKCKTKFKDESQIEQIGVTASLSNVIHPDHDEGVWEEVESKIIEIDFTKIHDLGQKSKKGFQDDESDAFWQNSRVVVSQSMAEQVFSTNSAIQRSEISAQSVEGINRSSKQLKNGQNMIAIQRKLGKTQWFEGEFFPAVGTSVLVEVDTERNSVEIVSMNESQFLLHRKHHGSISKLSKLIKVESQIKNGHNAKEESIKDDRGIVSSERKRDKKKKWKQHSKIHIQKLEGVYQRELKDEKSSSEQEGQSLIFNEGESKSVPL